MGRKTYNIDVYALFYMESYHVTHVIITKLNDLRAIRNKLNSLDKLKLKFDHLACTRLVQFRI